MLLLLLCCLSPFPFDLFESRSLDGVEGLCSAARVLSLCGDPSSGKLVCPLLLPPPAAAAAAKVPSEPDAVVLLELSLPGLVLPLR